MKFGFWHLFKTDLKHGTTNWVAAILLGGLIILPSLYAWMNIEASWDPYGRTENIKIGVVNEDTGGEVRGESIDVGETLVDSLKENDTMNWQFVTKEKAMDELEYGNYFATIIIPEDFSKKLSTVITDNPEKANIEYYVNEKINAIAPKITDKGAGAIVDKVSSQFISEVNGVIFEMFNDLGIEMEQSLPDIKRFENYIFTLEENLPEIHQILNQSLSDADKAEGMINDAQGLIPTVKDAANNGLTTVNDTLGYLEKAENRLKEMAPKIEQDLKKIQSTSQKINDFLHEIENNQPEITQGSEILNQVNGQLDSTLESLNTIETALKQLQEQNNNENNPDNGEPEQNDQQIETALNQIASIKESINTMKTNTSEVESTIQEKQQEIDERFQSLTQFSDDVNTTIDSFVKEYQQTIAPRVEEEIKQAESTLTTAKNILVEVQNTLPEIEQMLNNTEGNLAEGEEMLNYVLGEFPYVNDKINTLADKIRSIQSETDMEEIIKLLQNDPNAEKGFFEEPVTLDTNKVFPIENYGTGMTPFYTVLAIWVGGLLLISLMSTEPHDPSIYTERHMYFGRLLTFYVIGILQTFIVTFGDLFLLGVSVDSAVWFVLFGLLISLIFISIVYTLVSVFGDVGKAMAIVLLVLQIAAAGGTYPAVLLPEFFQVIHPFLPFTYGINLMREAVGGIVWDKVYADASILTLFGIAAILIGAFLKKPINHYTNKLKKKSKESGLFH